MSKFFSILMLIAGLSGSLRAELPVITFSGVKYELAAVDVAKNGTITNEYVPLGENINSWTKLFAVRYWPKTSTIKEATNAWVSMIRPLLARDAVMFAADKNPNDVIIEAWLSAPDKSYIEANLHHFIVEDGTIGVKAYQFAEKIPMHDGKGDPNPFMKQRDSRCIELSKLRLEMHKAKK
jgi:hypothetical protein